jgi:MYXO-CTERM domain-containing protein
VDQTGHQSGAAYVFDLGHANGDSCTTSGTCAEGNCWHSSVCCDSPCVATCHACNVVGSAGTCALVAAGDVDPSGTCPDEGVLTCGTDGTCSVTGSCAKYASGATCQPASCASGSQTTKGTCDGSGSCKAGTASTCSPYLCGSTACRTACSLGSDCAPGFTCVGVQCVVATDAGAVDAGAEAESDARVDSSSAGSVDAAPMSDTGWDAKGAQDAVLSGDAGAEAASDATVDSSSAGNVDAAPTGDAKWDAKDAHDAVPSGDAKGAQDAVPPGDANPPDGGSVAVRDGGLPDQMCTYATVGTSCGEGAVCTDDHRCVAGALPQAGCGCRVGGGRVGTNGLLALSGLLITLSLRRRRDNREPTRSLLTARGARDRDGRRALHGRRCTLL